MKKKKIFDIEEIGFGDELVVKAPLPRKESKTIESIVSSGDNTSQLESPLSKEIKPVSTTLKSKPVSQVKKAPVRKIRYEAEEFISPVSGRKSKEPHIVHVAHGEYRLKGASSEEDRLSLEQDKMVRSDLEVTSLDLESYEQNPALEESQSMTQIQEELEVPEMMKEKTSATLSEEKEVSELPLEEKEISAALTETEKVSEMSIEAKGVDETSEEERVESEAVVEAKKISVESIEAKEISVAAIEAKEISAAAIEAKEISAAAIEAKEISAAAIEAKEISAAAIEAKEISAAAIETTEISAAAIEAKKVNEMLEEEREISEVSVEAKKISETLIETRGGSQTLIEEVDVNENQIEESWSLLEASGAVHDVEGVLDILENERTLPSLESLLKAAEDCDEPIIVEEETASTTLDHNSGLVEELDCEPFRDESFHKEVVNTVVLDQSEATFYETPSLDLLNEPEPEPSESDDWIIEKMEILEQTFMSFGVKVRLTGEFTQGPTVTQIEIQPELGTKISKILGLANDLKLNLSVEELRIEPIPGKNTIGVEVPNQNRRLVKLKEVLSRPEFVLHESPLYVGLGEDISGTPVYMDILKMPHGLIAGQTGSGKSVCINTLLISILYKASPEDVRLMLIDPKQVELAPYAGIGHLVTPVITDASSAAAGLKWAVDEMERRYELFARNGVRDINSFNNRRLDFELEYEKLPYIVIIIDELADLMMVSAQEVEDCIMRITQKARASGIHLIVATQRPTVDVITGTIKSNIPSRIAFAVAQANDSRVILDENGAQNLLGYGDMLWSQSGSKIKRVQGSYISEEEIDRVVSRVKSQGKPKYLIASQVFEKSISGSLAEGDPLIKQAIELFLERGYATASALQTKMSIGYNRAARIIDTLEQRGLISEPQGAARRREVKVTLEELNQLFN